MMSLMDKAKSLIKKVFFKDTDTNLRLNRDENIEYVKISKIEFHNLLLKLTIRAIANFDLKTVKNILEENHLDVQHGNNRLICTAITVSSMLPTQRSKLDDESKASIRAVKDIIKYLIIKGARPDEVENDEFINLFEWKACWHHAMMFYLTTEGDGEMIRWLHENSQFDFSQVYPECLVSAYLDEEYAIFTYLLNKPHFWTEQQSKKCAISLVDKIYKENHRWLLKKLIDRGMMFYFDVSLLGENWFEKLSKENKDIASSLKKFLGAKKEFNTRDDRQLFEYIQYVHELEIKKNDIVKPEVEIISVTE